MSDFDDEVARAIPADFYMFAGASDSQQSTEVSNVKTFELPDPAGKAGGACTSALLQTLYRDDDDDDIRYTWAETLELMREKITEIGLNQQPQLSTSRPIDVNEEIHIVPPGSEGTRRALLVGINYVGEPNALSGCQKDTRNVKEFLIERCGFERENMLILMDDGKHHQPTKQLIEDGLSRLADISEPGDCIFFQFSGHGGQMADKDGDEEDGYDEILIPGDFKESGHIVDDWIYSEFVTKVRAGVHVVALVDCCHSGTAMDLPYVCNVGEHEIRRDDGFKKPATGGGLKKEQKDKEKKKTKKDKDKKPKKKVLKKKLEEPDLEDEEQNESEEYNQDVEEAETQEKKKKKKGLIGRVKKQIKQDLESDSEEQEGAVPETNEKKKKKGIFSRGKKASHENQEEHDDNQEEEQDNTDPAPQEKKKKKGFFGRGKK